MKFPRRSITVKLLLLFLFVGLSSVLIVGGYSFYSAQRAIMHRTIDQLISVRAIKKQQLVYFFTEKIKNIENLSRHENIRKEDYLVYGFTNLFLVSDNPGHFRILSFDSCRLKRITPNTISHIKMITNEVKKKEEITISDLFYPSPQDSVPVCLIGCYRKPANADSSEYIILVLPALQINQMMLQDNSRIGLGRSGEAYLVGSDLLMRSASRFIHGSLLRIPVQSETVKMALAGKTGASLTDDYRGTRVFSAYEPFKLSGLNWVVLAEIDYEEAMIPVKDLRNDILLVSIIISVFILGFAQVITRMITLPIISLKNAASRLGKGDFENKVRIHSKDEIGSLAETFNTMSDQVREERRKRIMALFDGQEMERRRISRELHDGLGQQLIGTKLQIETCDSDDPACIRKTMEETKSSLHGIVDELRRISNDLRPVSLDELGLKTALSNLCSEVGRQVGIDIEFDADINSQPEASTTVFLFRIAQEGIHNVIKHAKAGNVSLQLIENRDSLIMILEDDGIGFDPSIAGKGNGLSNMKERANLLGGTFNIESEPGKGTTIRVKIPTENEKSH